MATTKVLIIFFLEGRNPHFKGIETPVSGGLLVPPPRSYFIGVLFPLRHPRLSVVAKLCFRALRSLPLFCSAPLNSRVLLSDHILTLSEGEGRLQREKCMTTKEATKVGWWCALKDGEMLCIRVTFCTPKGQGRRNSGHINTLREHIFTGPVQ